MSQVEEIDARIGYAAKRLQQAVRAAAEDLLRPIGLTMPQYAALSVLANQPGLSNSELARRSFVTRQTMNELLAGLQRAGLVTRARDPQDGRVQPTELTVDGRALAERGDFVVADVEEQMSQGLTYIQRQQLLDLMRTCTANLEAPVSGPSPARPARRSRR